MYLPKRDELLLRSVLALPNASRRGDAARTRCSTSSTTPPVRRCEKLSWWSRSCPPPTRPRCDRLRPARCHRGVARGGFVAGRGVLDGLSGDRGFDIAREHRLVEGGREVLERVERDHAIPIDVVNLGGLEAHALREEDRRRVHLGERPLRRRRRTATRRRCPARSRPPAKDRGTRMRRPRRPRARAVVEAREHEASSAHCSPSCARPGSPCTNTSSELTFAQ